MSARPDEFADTWGDIAPVGFAVAAWRVASAPDGPGDEFAPAARRAVAVLTRELDALLAPLIGQLEAGVPADS
ncbi:hypothetical protein [Micromonospora sp. IBHARD004]|uniref:hypothetical protein n=1 Tax=Micromonospora sp. IBHARD004 TaxID=3457764 RepID=UPI004059B78B